MVFISHSSKDRATADAICTHLESAGIKCWIAPRDSISSSPNTVITRQMRGRAPSAIANLRACDTRLPLAQSREQPSLI
jgi:TIR domain